MYCELRPTIIILLIYTIILVSLYNNNFQYRIINIYYILCLGVSGQIFKDSRHKLQCMIGNCIRSILMVHNTVRNVQAII